MIRSSTIPQHIKSAPLPRGALFVCLPNDSPTRHELLSRIVNPERRKKRRQSRLYTSLPLEGKAAIRESHLLKKAAHHPCEPIRSPSTVIPSEAEGSLLHCRHMHTCALTQTTPWCFLFRLSLTHVLPVCKKDPSNSALMTRKKDGSSHIVFHTAA